MFKSIEILALSIKNLSLKGFWNAHSILDKIYFVFAIFVLICVIVFLIKRIKTSPKKKLNFIINAQKSGCMAVGKLSCLTVHGVEQPEYYEAEYMYVVEGVRYFVTYYMLINLPIDDHKDEMNADMLLLNLNQFMLIYYDKDNPKNALSKLEIFTSSYAVRQIKTPKNNVYRNVDKEWTEPINMVQY